VFTDCPQQKPKVGAGAMYGANYADTYESDFMVMERCLPM
jgi:hypothetical protein